MNSYTPLDIDKFRSEHPDTQKDAPNPSSDLHMGGFPPRSNRFPLFAIFFLAITFFVTLIIVSKFAQSPNIQKTEAEQPKPVRKVLKIFAGTDATFPPMESINANKEIVGYDVELGQKLANEMNASIEFVNVPWDQIFTSLEQKKIDVIISSVSITEERKMKYIYSDPYLNAGQVVITKKNNTIIKSPRDLAGKKVGVQKGTTNEQEAAKYTSDKLVIRYEDFIGAARDLLDDKVDAIFSDLPGAKGIITSNSELKIASDPFTEEFYGILFRKDETELRDNINTALTSLRQKGILNNLKEKYLN